MDLAAFMNSLTVEDLNDIFPSGNRTPAAALARYRAYISDANTPAGLMADLKRVRVLADFAPNVGHKRGALIVAIAILVGAVKFKNVRPLTPKMETMINSTFSEGFRAEFVKLFCSPGTHSISWCKDGGTKVIKVPQSMHDDADLVSWCKVVWAPIRT